MSSEEDIYSILETEGFFQTEKEFRFKKLKKKADKILNKYQTKPDDSFELSEREERVMFNNNFIESNNINIINHIFNIKNKYIDQLKNYDYINIDNLHNLKLGGFVRYIDLNDKLYWGGILLKIENEKKYDKMLLFLKNTKNNVWKIRYQKYYIFYKKYKSQKQKFIDLFIKNNMI